jgi:fatty acid desaturase
MLSSDGGNARTSDDAVSSVVLPKRSRRSVAPYRFSKELLDQLAPCFTKDNWHALLAVANDWLVIFMAIDVSLALWALAPLPIGILAYAMAVLVIGARQRALATLLHDATHGILARSRWLNHFLGGYASGYLILQSYSGYFFTHVVRHHGGFGEQGRDPDYTDHVRRGLYGSNRSAQRLSVYLRGIIGPATTLAYFSYLVRNRILPVEEKASERPVRLAFVGAVVVGACLAGWLPVVVAYWVVPMVTSANWIGALIELAEHYPRMEVGQRLTIYMSRNRLCNGFENFFLGLHKEGYHLIHHLFPTMPSWQYERAHLILMQDPTYRQMNQTRGWHAILREMSQEAELPAVASVEVAA